MKSKIALNGFFGRMGQSIYEESKKYTDCEITVGCDIEEKILSKEFKNITLTSNLKNHNSLFDCVIDFSLPNSSLIAVELCNSLNKPITIGTTGFTEEQLNQIQKFSKNIPILLAPNMSFGVNATFSLIEKMAKILPDYNVRIKEVHHKNKLDKPSGTAIKIAQILSNEKNIEIGDINSPNCPIKIDSDRIDSEIGTHEVVFKNNENEISIKHTAFNRSIFAAGALKTAMWIKDQPAGFYNYSNFISSKS